ncbi:MAG: hypothetical protein H3C47_15840, partial [Candidatus Cloacimonetes bacterium]|nr:hypothetical protein [Candidatus Cloacimonadota bacterium]
WNWLIDLKGKIPNVILSDSTMNVSSFDLMDLADLCLVSISSAGLESMSFGLPVMSIWPSQTCWPVEEKFRNVSTPEVYFETIEGMIQERPVREIETSLFASGYGAFLVSANNAFFSINQFWEKNTGPNSMDPLEKQRRINLDLPVLSFQKYYEDFQIDDDELDKFCHVLETREEMYCGFLKQTSGKSFRNSSVLKAMIALWMKTVESCEEKQLDLNKTYAFFQRYLACAESRDTKV